MVIKKTRDEVADAPPEKEELRAAFEEWVEKQGGKDSFLKERRFEKLTALIRTATRSTTVGELEEEAAKAGMPNGVKELTIDQLKAMLNPEPATVPKRRGRIPREAGAKGVSPRKRGDATKEVLKFVSGHPGCKAGDIAKATGIEPKKLSQNLAYIRKQAWVSTEGKLRGMTYKISTQGKRRLGS